ncbi:MAG TPA: NUDIX domain-containing protein [Lysobacter sp.]|nr:NUDIX domain-containing protein [Lysobacter sp.]
MGAPRLHDCVGALLVRDGTVLLGRRAEDRAWLPGAWDVFGGHIEAGETEEVALRRELREELGIVPLTSAWLATIGGDNPEPWRLHLYLVTAWRGEPRNRQGHEHCELRWCSLDEARERLGAAHPEFPPLLARALAG